MTTVIGYLSRYPPVHCGIAEYTKFLISAIRSIGEDLKLYIFSTDEAYKEVYIDDIGVKVIPSFKRLDNKFSKLLDNLAEVDGVDILHVQHEYGIFGDGTAMLEALSQAKEERLVGKVMITMHTVDHPSTDREYALKFQASLNQMDAVIVHSTLQYFELLMQNVDSMKVYRIPHGTLINPYLRLTRSTLSESIGIDDEEFRGMVIAVPGFLRRDKGVDVLLRALNALGDTRFTIILAGELQDKELKRLLEEEGKFRTVFIERYLSSDEILRVVALADAIVLPYKDRKGAYAVSGILHLSMGGLKPIIGTRTPRLIELYQLAPELTVAPNDPRGLADKIRWLVRNYDYALAYMADVYSYAARTQWSRVAYEHIKLYRNLIGNGSSS